MQASRLLDSPYWDAAPGGTSWDVNVGRQPVLIAAAYIQTRLPGVIELALERRVLGGCPPAGRCGVVAERHRPSSVPLQVDTEPRCGLTLDLAAV